MSVTKKRAVIIIAVILVFTASFSLGYIYDRAPNITAGRGDKKDNLEKEPNDWFYDLPEGDSFDWLFNIVLGLIIGLLVGSIMGIMMVSRDDVLAFIAAVVSIGFLFIISLYIDINPDTGGLTYSLYFTEWFKSNMFTIELSSAMKGGIILLLLLTIAATAIFKIHSVSREGEETVDDREGSKKEEKMDITEEVSDTVDEAVRELRRGGDPRSVIIRCYQRMCRIVGKDGMSPDESLTPREFQERTLTRLSVSRSTMDQLTHSFEEARYSDHLLKERDVERARRALKKLKNELKVID